MSTVAAIFGSRSLEHEVSVITAQQAMAALGPRHQALPVYIAKDGRWYVGETLRDLSRFNHVEQLLQSCTAVTPLIDPATQGLTLVADSGQQRRGLFARGSSQAICADLAMPLVHGGFGEDGTLQGLLEMAGVPYTGSDVAASAIAMDKRLAKAMFRAADLPVLDDVLIERSQWSADPASALAEVGGGRPFPLYVKPATLGSSIGVSRVAGEAELRAAVELALTYDARCLVEPAQENIIEINCAILGDQDRTRASMLEQPVGSGLLSYDDKYRGGTAKSQGMKGARRLIPAPLDADLATRITDAATRAFTTIGASGVARVDFLVEPDAGSFMVNEINPIPGSLSFYLFEPAGLPFTDLLDQLIAMALRRHARRAQSTRVFDTWMLSGAGTKASA